MIFKTPFFLELVPWALIYFWDVKGERLFKEGGLTREALIKCIKKTPKYFQLFSLIKQLEQ